MARGSCTFKQQDVTRALRAAVAAGIKVQQIEIGKDGRIVIVASPGAATSSLDELDRELIEFEARHG